MVLPPALPPRFVGRTNQTRALLQLFHSAREGVAQFLVLYGRRRVGKSTLIARFQADLPERCRIVNFNATLEPDAVLRQRFRATLATAEVETYDDSWAGLLEAALASTGDGPLVLAIDEAPYLVEANPGWATILQHAWDQVRHVRRPDAPLLILTGSAISTMSTLVSSGGPLHDRPTKLIRLDPLSLAEAHDLLGAPEPTTTLEAYAACGGYPLLLGRWSTHESASDNLIRLAGDPLGALAANANAQLLDMPDPAGFRRVLTVIGGDAHKLQEISSRLGQRPDRTLAALETAGWVARVAPTGEPRAKNVRYELDDGYLRFWFSIVDRNLAYIEQGQGVTAIRLAAQLWERVVADTFERAARNHAARLVEAGQLPLARIGSWWRDTGVQAQIDVVGIAGSRWLLVGEVKWSKRFDGAALSQLDRGISIAGKRPDDLTLVGWSIDGPTADAKRRRPAMLHYTVADVVSSAG